MTIRQLIIALPVVVLGWLLVMAGAMRFTDASPAAVVLFPSERLLGALPDDTSILDLSAYALIVVNHPRTTETLYAAGARLVLPAGMIGCLPLTDKQRARLG